MQLTPAVAMCPVLSPARRKASGGRAQALNVSSVLLANDLLDLGHASVTPREAPGGPWAASCRSCGPPRWSRVTLGSAGASGTCCVASHGRRHTHIAPSAHRKKNACNGRIYGRLSGRNYDICRFKSSFIPPVRSPEAWGARPSELQTCRNHSVSAYRQAPR